LISRYQAAFLLIHDAHGDTGDIVPIANTVGVPPPFHEMVLYKMTDGQWQKVRSWPIPTALIYRCRAAERCD
jgi:hypothetical protein